MPRCLYNQALSDVRSTDAVINCLYCIFVVRVFCVLICFSFISYVA